MALADNSPDSTADTADPRWPGAIGITAPKSVYLKRLFSLSPMLHLGPCFPERHLVLIFIHFQKFK